MIKKLINPLTDNYKEFKNFVISDDMPWFWWETSTPGLLEVDEYHNFGFYSHAFLVRPNEGGNFFSRPNSQFLNSAQQIFMEIASANSMNVNVIYRMNANCVMPTQEQKFSIPHYDHNFPHKNCLIYLTNTGGNLRLFEGNKIIEHNPYEDDVIVFGGKHCLKPPKNGRRISIVVTFS